jgi:hypothetical protein
VELPGRDLQLLEVEVALDSQTVSKTLVVELEMLVLEVLVL